MYVQILISAKRFCIIYREWLQKFVKRKSTLKWYIKALMKSVYLLRVFCGFIFR